MAIPHVPADRRSSYASRSSPEGSSPGRQLPTETRAAGAFTARRGTRSATRSSGSPISAWSKPDQARAPSWQRNIDPYVTTLTADPKGPGDDKVLIGSDESSRHESEVRQSPGRKPSYSEPQVEIQEASDDVAAGLWVTKGTEVISRHERRYIDGTPWSMQTSYYPAEFADRGAGRLRSARNINEGTVKYLADTLYIRQVGYRDWITVRVPNAIEADFFKLPSDGRVPMCEIFRTAFDGNGQPMRLTVTVYPADRNQFIVNVGSVPTSFSNHESQETDLEHLYHLLSRKDGLDKLRIQQSPQFVSLVSRRFPLLWTVLVEREPWPNTSSGRHPRRVGDGHRYRAILALGTWKNLRADMVI